MHSVIWTPTIKLRMSCLQTVIEVLHMVILSVMIRKEVQSLSN